MKPLGPEVLYEALASPLGIVLLVDDVERARQTLYRLRREAADPDLQQLALAPSPEAPTTELWIIKKDKAGA